MSKSHMKYFSEREQGERPRSGESLTDIVWRGIQTEILARINDGSFGARYPEVCHDGSGPVGTDERAFANALQSRVPSLGSQPYLGQGSAVPATHDVMDMLEFCWRSIGKPIRQGYHSYFKHHHLDYNVEEGQAEFCDAINEILRRNSMAYELTDNGTVQRLAAPVLHDALAQALFSTGDHPLDRLLEDARLKFSSPDEQVRREALEKLWDAFERLKTLEPGNNKSAQAKLLLDKAAGPASPKFREFLDLEAAALTKIGNTLHIRHTETSQEPLSSSREVDYLFHRLFALISLLLRATGRM